MSIWRPIHTAPKTGEDIIIGFDCASVWIIHIAYWDEDEPGWWSHVTNSVGQENVEPTHWMALPTPPNQ